MPPATPSHIFATLAALSTEQASQLAARALDLVLHYHRGNTIAELVAAIGRSRTWFHGARRAPAPDLIWAVSLHYCDGDLDRANHLFPLFYGEDPMAAVDQLREWHPDRFHELTLTAA